MAGDWLKIESDTPDKPEILAMAAALDLDTDCVFGKCFRLWRWFDAHTEKGNARGVTKALLNRMVGVTNFAEEMEKVGWLIEDENGVTLQNFSRHNGKTAKTRALTAKRVSECKKSNASSVTKVTSDALPTEENRREDINTDRTVGHDPIRKEKCRQDVIQSLDVLKDASRVSIESLPMRSLDKGAFAALREEHLSDTPVLLEWFSRQLALPDPVCQATRADLLLVLAAGIYVSKMPPSSVKKSRCAIFVDIINKGRWRKVTPYIDHAVQKLNEHEAKGCHESTQVQAS